MKTRILFWLVPDDFTKKIFNKIKKKYPGSKIVDFKSKNDLASKLLDYKYLFNNQKLEKKFTKITSIIYKENINEWLDNYYSRRMDQDINIFTLREIFKRQVNYIINYLKNNKISHLLISADSAIGIDFLTYKIAQSIGIKTIFLFGEHRNFFFYTYNKFDWGNFKTGDKKINNITYSDSDNIFKYKKPFYMKREFPMSNNKYLNVIFSNFRQQIKKSIKVLFNFEFYKIWKMQKNLNYISKNLPRNYVYFSLNHQPEATTIAWGNGFIDQISAIEKLRLILPKKVKIIVKDHPAQNDIYHRDKLFMDRLMSIDNLILTNCRDNTQLLINKSKCVALIYGTTGWEALQNRKPVISFGQNWYNNVHGVFMYNIKLKYNKIINFNFDKDKFKNSINKLIKKSAPGMVYKEIQRDASDISSNFKTQIFNETKEIDKTYESILKLI